jgi:hypothetical protein
MIINLSTGFSIWPGEERSRTGYAAVHRGRYYGPYWSVERAEKALEGIKENLLEKHTGNLGEPNENGSLTGFERSVKCMTNPNRITKTTSRPKKERQPKKKIRRGKPNKVHLGILGCKVNPTVVD